MANSVLVGSTGFVGGNLMASHPFDAAYHSSNVQPVSYTHLTSRIAFELFTG